MRVDLGVQGQQGTFEELRTFQNDWGVELGMSRGGSLLRGSGMISDEVK